MSWTLEFSTYLVINRTIFCDIHDICNKATQIQYTPDNSNLQGTDENGSS